MIKRALVLASLGLAGVVAQAGDFEPLMDVARSTWPTKLHIAVVADYATSAAEIQTLADAAGAGATITVLDTHNTARPFAVHRALVNRIRPDYVVLLRGDATFREGTPESTWLVGQVARAGIPSIGTTPVSIHQGAVFAVGPQTGNQILVNPDISGTVHVVLPQRESFRSVAALGPMAGRALIERFNVAGK